ncbi:hypothetical protein C3941_01860 [Kaistia algarum]|uniref:hypothetical protein n=1 Tax=Kaistia algarum TaxID=2083279 RepID=UPI000CE7832A|nr:hypothetical protein [Kaistia algarum]MCX5513034.1 hypothetical protein [Kaistia algarum]PPE81484.1 hypothetical protein C3941_01860 [Kaistia algarum]
MRAFLRILFLIPIGFMAAIATAIFVYLAAFGFREQDLWGGPGHFIPIIVEPVMILIAGIAQTAALPFLAGIVLSEILAIRSVIAWMIFGGGIGLGVHLFAFPGNTEFLPPLAAGLAAGFAYWLVAGHGAGVNRPISSAPE